MIIKATQKSLKIAGIKPVILENSDQENLPGEWYANTIKTGKAGKLVTLFFHNHTKISILCNSKSLNIAIKQLPLKTEKFLQRNGFESLTNLFNLHSETFISKTTSRSTLSQMSSLILGLEYDFLIHEKIDDKLLEKLEDYSARFIFPSKGTKDYDSPLDILSKYMK